MCQKCGTVFYASEYVDVRKIIARHYDITHQIRVRFVAQETIEDDVEEIDPELIADYVESLNCEPLTNVTPDMTIKEVLEVPGIYHKSWRHMFNLMKREGIVEALSDAIEGLPNYVGEGDEPLILMSPPRQLIFHNFQWSLSKIRVCIVGQDPYPGISSTTHLPDAMGLAFSAPKRNGIKSSAANIFKQIAKTWQQLYTLDPEIGPYEAPTHCDLRGWMDQGVFLFNICPMLIPRSEKPVNCWMFFTNILIKTICDRHPDCIWMLWGNSAQSIIPTLKKHLDSNYNADNVLCASHPSGRNKESTFADCNHFLYANMLLNRREEPLINWSV